MTLRLVRFTSTAQEHVRREKDWWLENRTRTEIFVTELEQALKVLTVLPGHIYYTFDEHEVIVRALWGAKRDRGPVIEPQFRF